MLALCKRISGRFWALTALALLVIVSAGSPLSAQSVTEGYSSDEPVQRGMLVAIKKDDAKKIEAITSSSLDRLRGVVIQASDSPVTLSRDDQKIFVATSGTYPALVSDQNGPIKQGDYISISPLAGIGMKATDTQSVVLGRATVEFKGKEDTVSTSPAKGGSQQEVHFGRVMVNISINRNPLLKAVDNSKVPKFLERISQTVANKPLSASRIYIATAIFIAASIIAGIMLYSGARNALISIGRNPSAKKAIIRGLVQVVILSIIVFIIGIFGVYLLLKL